VVIGRWTCNREVAGSSPGRSASRNDCGQVVFTHNVPLFTKQYKLVPTIGWEGNGRSGVALAMRHRHSVTIHLQAQWPGKGWTSTLSTLHSDFRVLQHLYLYFTLRLDFAHECPRKIPKYGKMGAKFVLTSPFRSEVKENFYHSILPHVL